MMDRHNTGAATLLIHMLAKAATNIFVTNTVRGLVPALLRTNVAILFAISYFERAAATVNPPRRSKMTGVHIAATMYLVAALASNRLWGLSSDRITLKTTHRNGIKREVTNRGMT
jgi:hypothetical protein